MGHQTHQMIESGNRDQHCEDISALNVEIFSVNCVVSEFNDTSDVSDSLRKD